MLPSSLMVVVHAMMNDEGTRPLSPIDCPIITDETVERSIFHGSATCFDQHGT